MISPETAALKTKTKLSAIRAGCVGPSTSGVGHARTERTEPATAYRWRAGVSTTRRKATAPRTYNGMPDRLIRDAVATSPPVRLTHRKEAYCPSVFAPRFQLA